MIINITQTKIKIEPRIKFKLYIKDKYLHLTVTLTVRLTGSPTPLLAVQRYVPFELLMMLLIMYFPSTTGSSGVLSVPLSKALVQVMLGVGLPVALQLKVTMEPSQTT